MEEDQEDMSPFWQPSRRRRRPSSSFFFNSGFLLILLLSLALIFMFIIIPSFTSFTSQILKPHSVKKGWDSLNLVLVLFAVICCFLSRNGGGDSDRKTPFEEDHYRALNRSQDSFQRQSSSSSTPLTPQRFWFDQDLLLSKAHSNNGRLNRLRSFSSYPDLRQHDVQEEEEEEASWGHRQWRFYDDTDLYNYRSPTLDQPPPPPHPQMVEKRGGKEEDVKKKTGIDVDTTLFVIEKEKKVVYTPPSPSAPPQPAEEAVVEVEASPLPTPYEDSPPDPPKTVRRRARRTYEDVGKSERRRNNDLSEITSTSSQPPRPPPSPPRPPSPPPPQKEEFEEDGKKKSGGTSATKEFLISLKRKKKNRQRQKSVENLDSFFNYESSYTLPWIPPPSPPPPPPPPPPFFQNLFSSKKRKTKKIHSVQTAPPRPPPPPPPRPVPNSQQLSRKTTVKDTAYTTEKPPLPVRIRSYNNAGAEENVNSGGESPLNSIPPPPPPPPFNIPVWKYEVHGDYVRLKSINYIDAEESGGPSSDGGDMAPPPFCPSPDVNMKADNFIKKFRDGLKLEKMNSVKEKEGRVGRSNLGPGPGPGFGPS